MRKITILAALAAAIAFTGSKDDNNGDGAKPVRPVMNTVTISVSDSTWTYFSLESGAVVGTSPLADEDEDAKWRARKDWDFALCGDMLRTNSGTSGIGRGGVQAVTRLNFNAIETAPESGYAEDRNGVVVKR